MGAGCSTSASASHAQPEVRAVAVSSEQRAAATPERSSPPSAMSRQPVASNGERRLRLIHFNDVYNIDGAPKFCHKIKSFQDPEPLILCAGDCFNPSLLSTFKLGEQMPPVLNAIGVHCCCVGNHDFDFGVQQMTRLISKCNFPWLMANVIDKATGDTFADLRPYVIMEWQGVKVGLIGLIEEEWLTTLGAVDINTMVYQDFVEVGRRYGQEMKDQGAELLVALTHMRMPNDRRCAAELGDMYDMVLGGHDHHYEVEFTGPSNILMATSGTDFRDMTEIEVIMPPKGTKGRPKVQFWRHTITPDEPEDEECAKLVESFTGDLKSLMAKPMGLCLSELDGRFSTVRTRESNLGNMVADILRRTLECDVVLVNGGCLRSDVIHPAGDFTMGDLFNILPIMVNTMVIEITGAQIIKALENGVSMLPKLEGRFPQVSGMEYVFDLTRDPGSRILVGATKVGGKRIDLKKKYTLGSTAYIASGHDGYDTFNDCRVVVDDEEGIPVQTAIRNHFKTLHIMNKWQDRRHRLANQFAFSMAKRLRESKKQREEEEEKAGDASRGGSRAPSRQPSRALSEVGEDDVPPTRPWYERQDAGVAVLVHGRYCLNPHAEGRSMDIEDYKVRAATRIQADFRGMKDRQYVTSLRSREVSCAQVPSAAQVDSLPTLPDASLKVELPAVSEIEVKA